jgi:hypothetical protein
MSKVVTAPSELFRRFGAPLANTVWSWGAVRQSDGAVFLRVWQDREKRIGDTWCTMVLHDVAASPDPGNLGRQERMRHLDLIRNGAVCYLVMCEARDVDASPRSIKSINDRELFVGGRLLEMDGDLWIERVRRVAVRELMLKG